MSAQWTPVRVGPGGTPTGAPAGTPSGNPAAPSAGGAKAWANKNKVLLGAGAAGVVVVLALLTRGKSSDDTAATATMSGTTAGQNLGAYDSSASDVYNAIQPEVAALRDLIENWQANVVPVPGGATSDVTTPVTTTPTPSTVPVSTTTAGLVGTVTPNGNVTTSTSSGKVTVPVVNGQVIGGSALPSLTAAGKANSTAYTIAASQVKNIQANIAQFTKDNPNMTAADQKYLAKMKAQLATFGVSS